ncbi:MAG: LamG-like jellyroll fold domain-containing protein [Candidatus Sulfotelmatobacter sp.]
MTQIIIGPTGTSGLSVSTGLRFGSGLILGYGAFEGIIFIGAGGLIPSTEETIREAAQFRGSGALSLSTIQTTHIAATFRGAGSLLASAAVVDIIYRGTGSMSALADLGNAGLANFNGATSLSASATLAEAGFAAFSGAGVMSVVTRETEQEAAALAGTGRLSVTVFGAIHATATFAGSGSLSLPLFSLIFSEASSQYLSATGNVGINTQKFTIAKWFKRTSTGSTMGLYRAENGLGGALYFDVSFGFDDRLNIINNNGVTENVQKVTNATYTDTASWHHLCVAVDTTQLIADNRIRLYVDGTEVTSWNVDTNPAQNTNLNNNFAAEYLIGALPSSAYFDGKLSQYYYIDGQQLTPSSFISGTPGAPIAYTGTYTGVFDFYLNFSEGASVTTLGNDYSGEGNNWTLNNMTIANQSSDYP